MQIAHLSHYLESYCAYFVLREAPSNISELIQVTVALPDEATHEEHFVLGLESIEKRLRLVFIKLLQLQDLSLDFLEDLSWHAYRLQ